MVVTADSKGKAVLVTVGASGIGLAAVELFGRCGAKEDPAPLNDRQSDDPFRADRHRGARPGPGPASPRTATKTAAPACSLHYHRLPLRLARPRRHGARDGRRS